MLARTDPPGPRIASSVDVYAVMNHIAAATGAVNLGQAVPSDTPPALLDAAARAVAGGHNHYSPSAGTPALREAVATSARRRGLDYDAGSEITIAAGCTEALAAAMLALLAPGDEVLTFEPFYDAYPAIAAMAGARLTAVPLERRHDRYAADIDRLAAAVTPRTRALLINSPHNPTGMVLGDEELSAIADLTERHDLMVISDEVYEELAYDGSPRSAGAVSRLRDRSVVCSSASKSLCVSGWRIGWAMAPAAISGQLRHAHRFLSYCAPAPLQIAIADALDWADTTGHFAAQRDSFRARRDILVAGLTGAGLAPVNPSGGIVTIASTRALPAPSHPAGPGATAEWVAREFGVAGLPLDTFFRHPEHAAYLLRFTFASSPGELDLAVERLRGHHSAEVGTG